MFLTRFDPFKELEALNKKFYYVDDERGGIANFSPLVNTREGEYAYHLEMDLPGVKKEEISIDIKNSTLTISGERKTKDEIKKESYYKVESTFGSYSRSFTLPKNVDLENIEARYQDGVLEIIIPKIKQQSEDGKKIEIR